MKPLAMRIPRSPGLIGGALLLAAWLAAASGARQTRTPAALEVASSAALAVPDPMVLEVQAQGERLIERLHSAPAPSEPSRNPFAFATAPRPPAPKAAALDRAALESQAEAPQPALKLIGIAEHRLPEGVVRTALFSGEGGPYLLREGERLADRFRVGRIGADAVELIDIGTGSPVTLSLP